MRMMRAAVVVQVMVGLGLLLLEEGPFDEADLTSWLNVARVLTDLQPFSFSQNTNTNCKQQYLVITKFGALSLLPNR